MTDEELHLLVECDSCGEQSETGWGDTEYCTNCESRHQVCHIHLRTFYFDEGCRVCATEAQYVVELGRYDV